jgi:serine/threonine protein kinase
MLLINLSIHFGKYELEKTLGKGAFAKVRIARNVKNGAIVAIKVMDKEMIHKYKIVGKIKREISSMKLLSHPYVVQLHEVMANKKWIYLVLEYVSSGELLNKIKTQKQLREDEARKCFQQLIDGIDCCHRKNVYYRDLKPNYLLIDVDGNLKIADFGINALCQQHGSDGLIHTMCRTPSYIAPEVISSKGYNGTSTGLWSCGVILFILLAGYLPFKRHTMALYKKIFQA